jgi:ribonuclease Z
MRPIFDAELTNPSFGDPGVYLDLKFERRALLFDIGDITTLPTRKLLRISDVFVTHTHVDHFCGFDHLLRVCLGRDAGVRLWGPSGFIERVEHKLAAYTWNLVHRYATAFVVEACEYDGRERLESARFSSRERFVRESLATRVIRDGVLLREPLFQVSALPLEHHDITSLAFAFEEATHMNVWKNRLEALHLPTGPWLTALKHQVRMGAPDDTPIRVYWRTRDGAREVTLPLGQLRREVLQFVPGQKACYAADVADTESNRAALVEFARGAQLLFIEAAFLDCDRALARDRGHLTAGAAGRIARAAGVERAVPFHFSPRYMGRADELRDEFAAAATAAG